MVRTGSVKASGMRLLWPVARRTAMVSPTARPIPSIQAASRPLRAAGERTRRDDLPWVCTQGEGSCAIRVWDGAERVFRERNDQRYTHQGENHPSRQEVGP